MRKKFIVALVAASVLANGASVAFATDHSDSDNSSSPTTVPGRSNKDEKADKNEEGDKENRIKDEKARAAKRLKSKKARDAIERIFITAKAKALKVQNAAHKSAKKNKAGIRAAKNAYDIAIATAEKARITALQALLDD